MEQPDLKDSQWSEIFKNLELSSLPIKYIHSIRVTFNDGKIWDVDIEKSRKRNVIVQIEDSLERLFFEYQDTIKDIDFRLHTNKIKKDIQKKTNKFLNKGK